MKKKIPKCLKCKQRKLTEVKEYYDDNNYLRILYKCDNCNQNSTRIKKRPLKYILKIKCRYCKEPALRRRGYTYSKTGKRLTMRYRCSNCDKTMVPRQTRLRVRNWSKKVTSYVLKLIKTQTLDFNKYDNRKDKTYYSGRMIVKKVQERFKVKISHETVYNLILRYRPHKPRFA